MKFDEEKKVLIETMSQPEAKAFIKFLWSERERHLMDIEDIEILIGKVVIKFNLQGELDWLDDRR